MLRSSREQPQKCDKKATNGGRWGLRTDLEIGQLRAVIYASTTM